MTDRVLFEGEWLSIIERDGWYQFSRETNSDGVVYILAFRQGSEKRILGRFEICPAHSDGMKLSSITGGCRHGRDPSEVAIEEMYEEAGYFINLSQLIDLGKVNLTKSCDTIGHLYAVDVTGLARTEAPGDGTKGEEGAYCDWISVKDAIECKCPVMSTLIARAELFMNTHGISLLCQ